MQKSDFGGEASTPDFFEMDETTSLSRTLWRKRFTGSSSAVIDGVSLVESLSVTDVVSVEVSGVDCARTVVENRNRVNAAKMLFFMVSPDASVAAESQISASRVFL
ncbi:hypothetical protein DC3_52510 [Deinococcus cellulosilyticus NBRC 106333 = KACC 11606]|uniref:Uncharacterized protein n=1 Tax=Deinococcus cellulosilyticus (strain DSM 18568 / NBRC 106333 / KACC 11606 / 5516J-15) TaxID=1223518 RepID=A0A511NAP6_DEIC1|nr:hypothetical protein DC3_52510 [Deinococcus cellulosilyticus NBRC 106333 = KACC 11606]